MFIALFVLDNYILFTVRKSFHSEVMANFLSEYYDASIVTLTFKLLN